MTRNANAQRRWRAYSPLLAWLAYSGLTIYCYVGGPFVFSHTDSVTLALYLMAVHVAIAVGYWLGVSRYANRRAESPIRQRSLKRVVLVLSVFALLGVAIAVGANFVAGITLDAALEDPNATRQSWIASGGQLASHLTVIGSIAYYPLIGTTFAYWRLLRFWYRIPAFLLLAGIAVTAVQGGSRAGIFGAVAVAFAAASAGAVSRHAPWKVRHVLVAAGTIAFAFALYASFIAVNRSVTRIDDYAGYLRTQTEIPIDPTHYSLDAVPRSIAPAVLSGYFYFGHGYEGLAEALDAPFVGIGFGLGHSAVLVRSAVAFLDFDSLMERSYFYRLVAEHRVSSSHWVTIYPWIASDLTFPGSVVFMGLLAFWFARAWLDVLSSRSIVAAWVVAWISFTIASTSGIFPPGDYGAFISFWGSIVVWRAVRNRSAVRNVVAVRNRALAS